jgi:exosortase/archaeosortase family protein
MTAVVVPMSTRVARRPGDIGRRALALRLGALTAVSAIGLWIPIRRTVESLDSQSPVGLVGFVLPLALVVGWHGLRSEPDPSRALPARSADVFIAVCFITVGLACAWLAPTAFGWGSATWRVELLAVPALAVGWICLLLGSRAVWLARRGLFLAALACPVWYAWAVAPVQRLGLWVGWPVVQLAARVSGVSTVSSAGLRSIGFPDGTMVVVGAVCAGASSVLGVGVVLTAVACLLQGSLRRKVAWVAGGCVLAIAGNAVRLGALTVVGARFGPRAALDLVHPWAGVAVSVVVTIVALLVSRRVGLRVPPPGNELVLHRLRAAAPTRTVIAAPMAVLVAGAAALGYAGLWRLDRMGGLSATANHDAAVVLPELAAADGWQLVEAEPVPWVQQFYGDATWRRFLLFDPAAPDASPIAVDVTTTRTPDTIDRLDLAACYGFHGRQVTHVIGDPALPDRPAERFAFDEGGATTHVVTWQTRVGGGAVQRVVVSQLHGHLDRVVEVAAALSEATPVERRAPVAAEALP